MGLKTTIFKTSFHQSNNLLEPHLGGNYYFINPIMRKNIRTIIFFVVPTAILDIEDEADYWSVVKNHTNNKEESIAAGKIYSLFLPVTKQLKYYIFVQIIPT